MVRAVVLVVMLSMGVSTSMSGLWLDVAAQEASPVADCPTTTEDENRAIIEQWYEAVDAHDLDALVELVTPVVTEHAVDVADAHSAQELKANLAPFFVAFPDLQDTIDQIFTIDNYVVARVTQSGTQRGDFLGIPATGRHATWTLIGIWRIECGRIAEHWVEVDSIGRLQQLGVLTQPGGGMATPAGAATASEMPASPAAACPPTTEAENEALVRRWYDEVYSQKTFANIDDIIAPNHIHHGPSRSTTGAEARQATVQRQQAAFPDLQITVDFLLAEGDDVVARWTARGTHTGPWQNIAPTGNVVTWTGNTIFRIACGRIAEDWVESDGLAFFAGIGVIEWPPVDGVVASPAAG